jgi:hypothetical protein
MPRTALVVLLSLGVLFGFGRGFAALAGHHHHDCAAWGGHPGRHPDEAAAVAPAAVQPQTIVVQPAAPAPAPAPQILIITPGAGPSVVTVPASGR